MDNTNETKPEIQQPNILQNVELASESPMPEVPRPKSNGKMLAGIGIVILLLIVGLILFNEKPKPKMDLVSNPQPQPKQEIPKPIQPPQKDELKQFKFTIPSTTSESIVNSMPKDFEIFTESSSGEKIIKKVTYEGGKNGYSISFYANAPLQEAYKKEHALVRSSSNLGWAFISSGSRLKMDTYYYVETRGANYGARIDLNYVGQNNTEIIIQAIEN